MSQVTSAILVPRSKELRARMWVVPVAIVAIVVAATVTTTAIAVTPPPALVSNPGIVGGNITHIIVIMQENRSFDSYFGTYKNPNGYLVHGIPMANGVPTTCVPDPADNTCVRPYLSQDPYSVSAIHKQPSAIGDINGGLMNGFISQAGQNNATADPSNKEAVSAAKQVMAYHDGLPVAGKPGILSSYWSMADNYLLQDNMFESVPSWSAPSHNYLVSGWSASYVSGGTATSTCVPPTTTSTPTTTTTLPICRTNLDDPKNRALATSTNYGWNSLAAKLTNHHVSWGFYSQNMAGPTPGPMSVTDGVSPPIWTPLAPMDPVKSPGPTFNDVNNSTSLPMAKLATKDLITAVGSCGPPDCPSIPQVSWVIPSFQTSEHPGTGISINLGESYVTNLVNAIGSNPNMWKHVAIFLSWDDWGGFYDHVAPPSCGPSSTCKFGPGDAGYGLRVPGLVISPYIKRGSVDSTPLQHDSYLKFIEDNFLSGKRVPNNDGRPDQRDVLAGDLSTEFVTPNCTPVPDCINLPGTVNAFKPIPQPPAPPTAAVPASPTAEAKAIANLND